ncbi:hypothetical protein [Bradyrhizobium sp.]|uniref:hypothetical protein n=1 Tax=Bradyrhizobium sp. TaxID=376 RepID=UPI003C71119F
MTLTTADPRDETLACHQQGPGQPTSQKTSNFINILPAAPAIAALVPQLPFLPGGKICRLLPRQEPLADCFAPIRPILAILEDGFPDAPNRPFRLSGTAIEPYI